VTIKPNHEIRRRRKAKGLTQEGLAEAICNAVEAAGHPRPRVDYQAIGRVERGLTTWPNKATREAYALILDAPGGDAELGFYPRRAAKTDKDDPLLPRRAFLAVAATVTAEVALFRPNGATIPPADLRTELARAQRLYREAQYAQLTDLVPALLNLAHNSDDHALKVQVNVLATEHFLKVGDDSYAYLTADRALRSAELAGDPISHANAAWMMCVMLRHAGKPRPGYEMAEAAAERVAADAPNSPLALATRGHLYLTAAYTAGMAGKPHDAAAYYREGRELASRFPSEQAHGLWFFGPAQADHYGISVHNNLADVGAALRYAGLVNPGALASTERRERYWYDVTRTHLAAGDQPSAAAAIRSLCLVAPQAANRPRVQLLATAAGLKTPGL